ncbi:MAG: hypothetical protein N5P05_001168 [Chroococcopsis gigantea SAG 12.99]|nr:hypothetical protein [Chroococcopsis gigantea SAG 12.99]
MDAILGAVAIFIVIAGLWMLLSGVKGMNDKL